MGGHIRGYVWIRIGSYSGTAAESRQAAPDTAQCWPTISAPICYPDLRQSFFRKKSEHFQEVISNVMEIVTAMVTTSNEKYAPPSVERLQKRENAQLF